MPEADCLVGKCIEDESARCRNRQVDHELVMPAAVEVQRRTFIRFSGDTGRGLIRLSIDSTSVYEGSQMLLPACSLGSDMRTDLTPAVT